MRTLPARSEVVAIALLVLLVWLVMRWQWIGLLGADDLVYSGAATDWLQHFPALAHDHWGLRYPVVFPIALAYLLGGVSEGTLVATAFLYFAASLVTLYLLVRRYFGVAEAVATLCIVMTIPITPTVASTVFSENSEVFFDLLSVYLFLRLLDTGRRGYALCCGVCAGIGFLSRETTVVVLLFYGLCFLFRPVVPRRHYVALFAGAFAVLALQVAYLWTQSGDPLFRQHLDVHHDTVDRVAQALRARTRGFALDNEGNLTVSPVVDPVLALFAAPKYALAFYAACAGGWACLRSRAMSPVQRRALGILAAVAVLWAAFIFANFEILYLVPRYIYFSALLGSALGGILLVRLWRGGARLAACLAALALAGSGVLLMGLQDAHPLFADRMLAAYAAAHPEPIHVDVRSAGPVNFLLAAAGSADRVAVGEPPPGGLAAAEIAPFYQRKGGAPVVDPARQSLVQVARIERPLRLSGRIAGAVGLERYLPGLVWRKISSPSPVLFIYRRPSDATPAATGKNGP